MSARPRVGAPTPDQRRARVYLLDWIVRLPANVEPSLAAGAEIARLAQTVECGDWRLEAIELLRQIQTGLPAATPGRRRPQLALVN